MGRMVYISSLLLELFAFYVTNYPTGKGKRLGTEDGWKGQGILKQSLPKWLSNRVFEDKISWFDVAPPNYGGNGAYIVYLKKLRE